MYSRFEVNGLRNRECRAGRFGIDFGSAISMYAGPSLPRFVLVSSAGVERNALCAGDDERRSREIPIVRLNPGGVLNYKYAAELALRNSGLEYCVVRPCGLVDDLEGEDATLELAQGDAITGRLTRREVARVVAAALETGDATRKTFEVRRSADAPQGEHAAGGDAMIGKMMKRLVDDWARPSAGIRPFPPYAPPPPPPSEETVREILEQVAVIQAAAE